MDAKLVINRHDLGRLPMSWFNHNGEKDQIEKKLKEAVNSRWDNSRLMFEYYGYFVLMISRKPFHKNSPMHNSVKHKITVAFSDETTGIGTPYTNIYEWNLWDANGQKALGNGLFAAKQNKPMPREIIQAITEKCDIFNKGYINCSGCNKLIHQDEIAGAYFAGRYCGHCWETKYKAIEAKETYN